MYDWRWVVRESGGEDGPEGGPEPGSWRSSDLSWLPDFPSGGVLLPMELEWNSDEYCGDGHPRLNHRLKDGLAEKPIWEHIDFSDGCMGCSKRKKNRCHCRLNFRQ